MASRLRGRRGDRRLDVASIRDQRYRSFSGWFEDLKERMGGN